MEFIQTLKEIKILFVGLFFILSRLDILLFF